MPRARQRAQTRHGETQPTRAPRLGHWLACILVGCVALAALGADVAHAQSGEVVQLFQTGLAAYRDGRYEEAAELFARAHAIEAVPDLTYNRARALENLGRFDDAADAYSLFLEESPASADRAGIEARIRTLRARAEEERRLAAENERLREERDALATAQTPEPMPEPTPTREASPAPWVTLGVGVAVAAGGGVLLGLAQADYDRAGSPSTPQREGLSLEARARDEGIAGYVLLGTGLVTGVVGLAWGLVVGSGTPERAQALRLAPNALVLRF